MTPSLLLRCAAPVAALALGLAGCAHLPESWEPVAATVTAADVPVNHLGEARMPVEVRRVVLLPVAATGEMLDPESATALDPVFATALQRRLRFEVVTLPRGECRRRFGADAFASSEMLPHDFLGTLGRLYGAEAVLFVDITAYRDNRPLTLGVRAKLAGVADARLIWSCDEVFSAADPVVADGARRHARREGQGDVPIDLSASVLQSPTRFADYVADAVFGTLPPR